MMMMMMMMTIDVVLALARGGDGIYGAILMMLMLRYNASIRVAD